MAKRKSNKKLKIGLDVKWLVFFLTLAITGLSYWLVRLKKEVASCRSENIKCQLATKDDRFLYIGRDFRIGVTQDQVVERLYHRLNMSDATIDPFDPVTTVVNEKSIEDTRSLTFYFSGKEGEALTKAYYEKILEIFENNVYLLQDQKTVLRDKAGWEEEISRFYNPDYSIGCSVTTLNKVEGNVYGVVQYKKFPNVSVICNDGDIQQSSEIVFSYNEVNVK